MKVVLAEKPSMARDIARVIGATNSKDGYLEGGGYQVTWAFGHLVEIYNPGAEGKWDAERLPILGNFTLQPKKEVGKQIKIIQRLFGSADEIICACDAGREGELIFRYLYHYLKCSKPFRRLWISSLTDSAIKEGFAKLKPGQAYDTLFDAARARSEADYYVGINATRALTLSINNREVFSLGRVQTPTMAIICRRFLEHKNFVPEPFWSLRVKTAKDGINFTARQKENYTDKAQAEADLARLSAEKTLLVSAVETKEKQENPPLLYDLTALQKAANEKHSMTPDKVLQIAQSLYESKYLSYPRTGSCYIPDDVFAAIPGLMAACSKLDAPDINATYYQRNPSLSDGCVNAAKVTDHHALLPTGKLPDLESLTKPEATIYLMVAARMFEAFHKKCIKDITSVALLAGSMELAASGTVVREAGWREVLQKEVKEADTEDALVEKDSHLPKLQQGDTLPNLGAALKEDKTKPRPLLTDATLLAYMETAGSEVEDEQAREAMKEGGLGTPATRDAIIKNIIDKQYVTREKKKLIPTSKGLATYEIIKDKVVGSPALTGEWEKKMSGIQVGAVKLEQFIAEVKTYATSITAELLEVNASIKSQQDEKNEKMPLCPKCRQNRLHTFEKGIGCTKECGFVLWRTVASKKLSDAQLVTLATKGITPPVKGFKTKEGKEFTASLMLDKDFKVTFPPKPTKK
ncbi:MAG: topoisomerase C-terminal repeat-containing protein [Prevotellaceae bacterium]|jgi:DNA topoisomerase-3|nr:topoisomerase C-terminal repeat-containing protein [Prevotellaceae bacterium]